MTSFFGIIILHWAQWLTSEAQALENQRANHPAGSYKVNVMLGLIVKELAHQNNQAFIGQEAPSVITMELLSTLMWHWVLNELFLYFRGRGWVVSFFHI